MKNTIHCTFSELPQKIRRLNYDASFIVTGTSGGNFLPIRQALKEIEKNKIKVRLNFSVVTGIMQIEKQAFVACRSLVGIRLPESVTEICFRAFDCCDCLKKIEFPKNLRIIGEESIYGCDSLKRVIIPDGVEEIASGAFRNCASLKSIAIPNTVKKIGDRAFSLCEKLTKIKLPDGLESIERETFCSCKHLRKISIPSNVRQIGYGAFENCRKLNQIAIPFGVEGISDSAFSDCEKLKNVKLPQSIKNIGKNAFRHCNRIKIIDIPSGVLQIGKMAFGGCVSLKKATIPNGILKIGNAAFYGCHSLKLKSLSSQFIVKDGLLLDSEQKIVLSSYGSYKKTVIPKTVTTISESAFRCATIKSIELPNGIETIEKETFCGCEKLKNIVIPNGVIKIKESAFEECTALESVKLPASVSLIEREVFECCPSLETVTFSYPLTENPTITFFEKPIKVILSFYKNSKKVKLFDIKPIVLENHSADECIRFCHIFLCALSNCTLSIELGDMINLHNSNKEIKIDFMLNTTKEKWQEKLSEFLPNHCTMIIQDSKEIPFVEGVGIVDEFLVQKNILATWMDCVVQGAKRNFTIFWEV